MHIHNLPRSISSMPKQFVYIVSETIFTGAADSVRRGFKPKDSIAPARGGPMDPAPRGDLARAAILRRARSPQGAGSTGSQCYTISIMYQKYRCAESVGVP